MQALKHYRYHLHAFFFRISSDYYGLYPSCVVSFSLDKKNLLRQMTTAYVHTFSFTFHIGFSVNIKFNKAPSQVNLLYAHVSAVFTLIPTERE